MKKDGQTLVCFALHAKTWQKSTVKYEIITPRDVLYKHKTRRILEQNSERLSGPKRVEKIASCEDLVDIAINLWWLNQRHRDMQNNGIHYGCNIQRGNS